MSKVRDSPIRSLTLMNITRPMVNWSHLNRRRQSCVPHHKKKANLLKIRSKGTPKTTLHVGG